MKKKYMTPHIKVAVIDVKTTILAGSNPSPVPTGTTVYTDESASDSYESLSKSHSVWNEE